MSTNDAVHPAPRTRPRTHPRVRRLDGGSVVGRRAIVAEFDGLVAVFGDRVGHLPAEVAPLGAQLLGLLATPAA